jgi:hypothetical protein
MRYELPLPPVCVRAIFFVELNVKLGVLESFVNVLEQLEIHPISREEHLSMRILKKY